VRYNGARRVLARISWTNRAARSEKLYPAADRPRTPKAYRRWMRPGTWTGVRTT
jgi:hypothetical protein